MTRLPRVSGGGQVYLSPGFNQTLDEALKQARLMKDDYVSTEHLLWALAADKGTDVGKLLKSQGLTPEAILKALADLQGRTAGHGPVPGGEVPAPGEVRQGPDGDGPVRQAGPGDRPGQ